jgi:putative endonuclease
MQKSYYVYILSSKSGTMYTGVTNDIERRMMEHKSGANDGFTRRYKIDSLVHYEEFEFVEDAIAREKEIKGWLREKKRVLIKANNPEWEDLAEGWYKG